MANSHLSGHCDGNLKTASPGRQRKWYTDDHHQDHRNELEAERLMRRKKDSEQFDQEIKASAADEVGDDLIRDVDITDDFMFSSVMSNAEICKELLEVLLPELCLV